MTAPLDKRDRRALRRLAAGKSTLESLPGYRREKLREYLREQTEEDRGPRPPENRFEAMGWDTLEERRIDLEEDP